MIISPTNPPASIPQQPANGPLSVGANTAPLPQKTPLSLPHRDRDAGNGGNCAASANHRLPETGDSRSADAAHANAQRPDHDHFSSTEKSGKINNDDDGGGGGGEINAGEIAKTGQRITNSLLIKNRTPYGTGSVRTSTDENRRAVRQITNASRRKSAK